MDEREYRQNRSGNNFNKSPGPIYNYEQYMYGGYDDNDRIEENSPNATISELDEDDEQIFNLVNSDEKPEQLFTTSESEKEQSDVVAVNHLDAGWGEIADTENISEEKVEAEREIANEVIAGALQGDFNSDPTFWSDIGQIVMGLVPVAGQLGDIRDLVHILDDITNKEGYKKIGSWATLVLIAIGFIPGVGDAIAKVGKRGIRYLDNNRILKRIGEWLGDNIIAPILEGVGDITAPIVGQIKDVIRRKLAEAQEIARQLGEGADNVIDDVAGQGQPRLATEGAGNVSPNQIDNTNQPRQNEPLQSQGNSNSYDNLSEPVRQNSSNLDELYQQAEEAQEYLSQATEEIASQLGGEPLIPPTLKGRERTLEKITADYGGDASRITDLARSSIIFENPQQVYQALEVLQNKFDLVRIKDRFQNPANGYRDILLNLEMPNGHVVEMQLHLRSILEVKNGIGHELYERVRSIKALAKSENRPLTSFEIEQIRESELEMEKLYEQAFEQSSLDN